MQAERHKRVMEVLADVLECDTGRRTAALSEACRGDESLRREVERLLSHKDSASDFLEDPPVESLSAADVEGSRVGKRIGPYTIEEEIGRGGMGSVYVAARSDSEYEKRVAVKLIRAGADAAFSSRRFRNERQILADLEHPNIARLLDGGTTEDGLPYLVMEYVEGEPVDKYARERRLSTVERLRLFRTVCSAVEYAHSKRVIHRDIKPGNILVTAEGVPKLLDFGIATLIVPDSPAPDTTGALSVMTPEYASPEQVRGEAATISTDIYSLGVVLYELLTGRRPYRLKSRRAEQVVKVICEQEPERPSAAVSRDEGANVHEDSREGATWAGFASRRKSESARLRRGLRGDLDNILLTALRKEPDRRYASVEEFSEDLRRHLEGLPVRARKDTLAYKGTKFFKRHKAYAALTLAVAVVCLLLGTLLTLSVVRVKTRGSVAVLPLVNASDDPNLEYLSDGITDDLITRLSRVPRLVVPAHNSVFSYKAKPADPRSVARDLGVETVLAGNVTTDGGDIIITASLSQSGDGKTIWSRQYRRRPYELQALQQEMTQEVARALGYEISDAEREQMQRRGTASAEAYSLYLKGDYLWNKRAAQSLTKAADYFRQATEADPRYALAYSGLANSYSLLGAYGCLKPDESFPVAKVAAARAVEIDPELPEGHNSLALVVWLYDWDWGGADREFRRALELNPNYPLAHHWYGLFLGEMGRADEAIAEEKRALELDPLSAPTIADLGRVYYFARRYDDALAQFKKASEMAPPSGDVAINTILLYQQMGMSSELMEFYGDPMIKKALAARDMKAFWRRLMDSQEKRPEWWPQHYGRAELFARAGEDERAVEQLNLDYAQRDHLMTQLKVNPAFDSLRSDPRFDELVRRMNLNP